MKIRNIERDRKPCRTFFDGDEKVTPSSSLSAAAPPSPPPSVGKVVVVVAGGGDAAAAVVVPVAADSINGKRAKLMISSWSERLLWSIL